MLGTFIFIIGFLISLSIHEAAHAWMSDRLGDPTARLSGRLSLNPLAHLDPIGTILPIFLILSGSPMVFGWGKPVPFDPFNLRSPRKDSALISLAGPTANLLMATILAVIIRISHLFLGPGAFLVQYFFSSMVALNIMWALFNLIPIHPLDGGKVLVGILPKKLAYRWDEILGQYGIILLIFLIFPFAGRAPIDYVLSPLVNLVLSILLPGTPII
jgi:Zn-dependent protease